MTRGVDQQWWVHRAQTNINLWLSVTMHRLPLAPEILATHDRTEVCTSLQRSFCLHMNDEGKLCAD